jgi:heme oxygenase (biliverdin-IX-beta and delta-forming)
MKSSHLSESDAPASAKGSTLRAMLRTSTAAVHRDLEAAELMRVVTTQAPSASDYADYLSRHWRLHAALEHRLRSWVPAAWLSERLCKAQTLVEDLCSLGQPMPHGHAEVPPIDSIGAAWGAMSVLEGATLGPSMVSKRLPNWHPARGQAGRFMAAYGEDTGARWQEFLRELGSLDAAEWPTAFASAVATFSAFLCAFKAPRP